MYEGIIPQTGAEARPARYRRCVDVAGSRAVEVLRRAVATPAVLDSLLAAVFVLAGLATTSEAAAGYEARDGVAVGLILAGTAPYVVRRRAPLPVFLCSLAAIAALFALGYDGGALPTVVAVGAYTVGAYRPLHEVLLAAAVMNAVFVGLVLTEPLGFGGGELAISSVGYGAVLLLGWSTQSRRMRLDALERQQVEAARRAAAEERVRIAHELHDVVAHSLGVIAVQAGVGAHVLDDDPAAARRALNHISSTSRASLAEVRALLGLLRSDERVALAPAPGLGDLHQLVAEISGAGLPVDLDLDAPSGLPEGLELAAYRIVQESLTNALRHANAGRATVQLRTTAASLHIVVADDGVGRGAGVGDGHGLVGMRERVAMYGGSLSAGPAPTGGFRVDATVPLAQPRAAGPVPA
jgi:signal transduction histidine kinase